VRRMVCGKKKNEAWSWLWRIYIRVGLYQIYCRTRYEYFTEVVADAGGRVVSWMAAGTKSRILYVFLYM
jgi:hypothetical protein